MMALEQNPAYEPVAFLSLTVKAESLKQVWKHEKEEMKKFSPLIFIISTTLIGILTFASFISLMAQRGDMHDLLFVKLFAPLFDIFRFPTHILFNFGKE